MGCDLGFNFKRPHVPFPLYLWKNWMFTKLKCCGLLIRFWTSVCFLDNFPLSGLLCPWKVNFVLSLDTGGFTWQWNLKASQVKILQRISYSCQLRIKVNSLYHSIAFKIFIKCIPCSWNLPEKLPSRVTIIKQWQCYLCFSELSDRRDSKLTV